MSLYSHIRSVMPPKLRVAFRTVPLRAAFIVPFVLEISLAVGITGWLSLRNGQQAVNDVAHQLRDEISQRINQKLSEFLSDPLLVNQLNLKAKQLDYIDLQDTEGLYRHFYEQSQDFETVESFFYGGADGEFIGKGRLESADRSQHLLMVAGEETRGSIQFYSLDKEGNPNQLVREVPAFDPRDRPWYKTAVAAGEPVWGEVFTYHAFPLIAIPAVVPVYDAEGNLQGVFGNNFFLDQVSEFLASLKVGQTGQTFIVERSGLILASSTLPQPFRLTEGVPERLNMLNSGDPLIEASAQFLLDHYGDLEEIRQSAQLEFQINRDRQFVQVAPFRDEKGLDWLIVVVVPESDFMGAIQANTRNTVFFCLGALGVAILLGLLTARWVTHPLLRLSRASKAIATGDLNQRVEIEGSQEVRHLAETFNHMAQQLQMLFLDVQRSETRFQNLAENMPGVIYRYIMFPDGSDSMPYMSPGCREVWGVEPQALEANTLWYLIHPDDEAAMRDSLASAYQSLQPWSWEWRIISASGQVRWLQATAKPQRQETGEVVWDGLILNITARKETEVLLQETNRELERRVIERTAQIQQANSRLSLALRAAHAGIWEWDMQTNEFFWSDENYRLMGYEPRDCISSYENWLNAIYPDDVERVQAYVNHVVEQEEALDLEYRVLLPDGQVRWLGDLGEIVYDADGQPKGMAGIQVDITSRKQAEEQLRLSSERLSLANGELARAARLKDEFLAGMSHELRTPLNSVLGLSEVLLESAFGELSDQQVQFVEMIQQSGRHLLDLINDILDLSKVQSGKMELQITQVSVAELCDISLCFVKQQANQKQITLEYQIDSEITEIWVDELRTRQVLINLLSNAVKFTPEEGSVTLTVDLDCHHEAVAFHVTDTGIGIPTEQMERLFQPFIQLDSGLARRYEGTGLGLALVKKIVELHGGSVTLESTVGKGSCFTVLFPREQQLGSNLEENDTEALAEYYTSAASQESRGLFEGAESYSQDVHGEGTETRLIRVLLAEDHEGNIILLSSYLQRHHMQVTVARSGIEVLDYVEQQSFDVILMDIQMPEMDGLTTMYRLQHNQAVQTIPIIVLTALAMPGDRERCMAAGAQDYLTKPVSLKYLRSLIWKYTQEKLP